MEIAVSALPLDDGECDDIIAYALSRGFEINLHAPFGVNNISSKDKELLESSVMNVFRSIDIAARHSLGVVTFHPGRLSEDTDSTEENFSQMLDSISRIALYAKEKRVKVGIENMEKRRYEYVLTIDDLNRFAHLTKDNPYFGATIDIAHYSSLNIGFPPLEKLRLPIFDTHLSQNVGGAMHCSLLADAGSIDLSKALRLLQDFSKDVFVVLEVRTDVLESRNMLESIYRSL